MFCFINPFFLLVLFHFLGFVFFPFCFFWGGGSFSLLFIESFSPEKWAFLCIFECLPFFLLSTPPFSSPFFHILLLCLFFFFLPSRLYLLFSFGSWFLCFSCLLLFDEKISILESFHHSFFLEGGFLFSFCFQTPFPYLCFFPHLTFRFFSASLFFFQKNAS